MTGNTPQKMKSIRKVQKIPKFKVKEAEILPPIGKLTDAKLDAKGLIIEFELTPTGKKMFNSITDEDLCIVIDYKINRNKKIWNKKNLNAGLYELSNVKLNKK